MILLIYYWYYLSSSERKFKPWIKHPMTPDAAPDQETLRSKRWVARPTSQWAPTTLLFERRCDGLVLEPKRKKHIYLQQYIHMHWPILSIHRVSCWWCWWRWWRWWWICHQGQTIQHISTLKARLVLIHSSWGVEWVENIFAYILHVLIIHIPQSFY